MNSNTYQWPIPEETIVVKGALDERREYLNDDSVDIQNLTKVAEIWIWGTNL